MYVLFIIYIYFYVVYIDYATHASLHFLYFHEVSWLSRSRARAKRFGETAGMRAACLYGGAPKGPQLAELRQRPQVLVATPGRLNDLLEPPPGLSVAVDVKSVRYLVLDEADRMLDMGFEPQIRKIISGLRKVNS